MPSILKIPNKQAWKPSILALKDRIWKNVDDSIPNIMDIQIILEMTSILDKSFVADMPSILDNQGWRYEVNAEIAWLDAIAFWTRLTIPNMPLQFKHS